MYSFNSVVRYSECDENGTITTPALINYLQDCSTFHSESIGRGVQYLAERHIAWFIMAWQISIDRLPRFCDPIVTSTWCYELKATSAKRNFTIVDERGDSMVRADSLWVMVDTQTGKPIRIPQDELVFVSDDAPLNMPPTKRKLRLEQTGTPHSPITITEQHLDSNHHVNNAQYILMANRIVRDVERDFDIATINVQYRTPAKLGDTLYPILHVEDDGYAVDLTDHEGSRFCAVRMVRRGEVR